jgi:hypothetical protein
LFGYIPETFKALGAGAAGTIEAGLTGASFLLPEEQEQAARRRIAEIGGGVQEFLAPDDAYEGMYLDVVRGLGSTAPFILAAPFGVPGVVAGAGLGIASGAGEAAQRAVAAGATEDEISTAAGLGIIPGAFEMVAPARIVSRARRALGPNTETIAKALDDSISARLSRVRAGGLGRVGTAVAQEAAQEAATEVMQNLISQGVYDPETETFAGVSESAQIGGSVGGLLQLFTEMALGIKSRGAAGAPPPPADPFSTGVEVSPDTAPGIAAPPPPPPPQQEGDLLGRQDVASVLSADDLQALGLNLNKATAEKLFGLDLAIPEQQAEARRILTAYTNNPKTQQLAPQTVSRISSLLRSDVFKPETNRRNQLAAEGRSREEIEDIIAKEAPGQRDVPQGTQLDMLDIDETRQIQDLLDTDELAQLQAEEDAQLAAQEVQRQRDEQARIEEETSLLGGRLDASRRAESEDRRRQVLLPIIERGEIPDAYNLARAFSAELQRQGFANTTPTESELSTIDRALGIQQAITTSEAEQAETAAALLARKEAEQRAGVSGLESLIPERRVSASTTPPELTPQEQERAEKARLNRERLDRTGRGLEGQLEIPAIERASAARVSPFERGVEVSGQTAPSVAAFTPLTEADLRDVEAEDPQSQRQLDMFAEPSPFEEGVEVSSDTAPGMAAPLTDSFEGGVRVSPDTPFEEEIGEVRLGGTPITFANVDDDTILYHATDAEFDTFDFDATRKNRASNVSGVYVNPNKNRVKEYGKNIKETRVRLGNVWNRLGGNQVSDQMAIAYRDALIKAGYKDDSWTDGLVDDFRKDQKFKDGLNGNLKREVLLAGGYDTFADGIIKNDKGEMELGDIVVLKPENIEILQQPASSPIVTKEMLDAAGVSNTAPVRKRVVGKNITDSTVQKDLTDFANNEDVKNKTPEVSAAVTDLVASASARMIPKPPPMPSLKGELKAKAAEVFGKLRTFKIDKNNKYSPEGSMAQYLSITDSPDQLLRTIAFESNPSEKGIINTVNNMKRAAAARQWIQANAPEYTPLLDTMVDIAKQEEAYRTARDAQRADLKVEAKLVKDRAKLAKLQEQEDAIVEDYIQSLGKVGFDGEPDSLSMEVVNTILEFTQGTSSVEVKAAVDKSAVREKLNVDVPAYKGVITRALRADAVAATMVNADPSVTEQLKNGNAFGALDSISKTTLNASVRRAADSLKQAIAGLKVSMNATLTDAKGNMLAGIYDAATDTLVINTSMPLSTHTVLHEATHAATIKVLKNPSHPTTQRLTQLYNNLKDKMPDEYAMQSLEEFVAEAFSNSEFQTKLAAYRISGDKITGWDRFWEAVGRLFGMNYTTDTANTEALNLINTILATAPNTRNATTIASAIAKDDPEKALNSLLSGGKNFIRNTPPSKLKDYAAVIARSSEKVRATLLNGLGLEGITNILKDVVPSAKEFEKIIYKMDGVRTQNMKTYTGLLNDMNKAFNGDPERREIYNELRAFSTLNELDPTADPDIVNKFWLRYGVINPSTNKATQKEEKFNTKEQMEARKAQLSAQIASAKAANRPSPILGDVSGIKATEPTDLRKANDAKVRQMFASLTPTQRGVYVKERDFYADINDKIIAAQDANVDRMDIDPEIKTSVKHTMLLRRILTGSIKPYFPLTRGGEFWVEFTYRNDDGQLVYGTGSFNSMLERGKAIEKLRNMTEVDRDSVRERSLSEIEQRVYDGSIPIPFLTDLQKQVKALEVKDKDGNEVNPEGKRQLNEFLANIILRSLPEQAIIQSRQIRQGVAFFEGDAATALQQRGPQFITSLSNLSYMVELEQVSKKVRDERDKLPDSEVFYKEAATIVAGTKQETEAMLVFGSLPSYLQFSKNPYLSNVARMLRSGTFTMTLAGNISSVAVNTGILPLVLQNTLAGRYGAVKATIASAMAAKLYVGSFGKVSREGITDLDADGKPLSPSAPIRELGGFSITNDFSTDPKRQAGYKKLEPLTSIFKERGFDTRTQAAEMSELDSPTAPWINKLNYLGGFLFAHSERGIRQVSAISTYILEMEKLTGKKFGKLTDPDIAQYGNKAAETAIDTMLYVNSSALITAAPRIAQTSAGSLVWQFKKVPGQMLYTHFSMLNSIFKDLTGKARTPAELEEARALRNTFFYTAAAGGVLVGVKGIPMYGVVASIANLFLDDDEDDFNTLIAKTMGEDKYYGLIANMFGVDITDRVSLTNLMIRDRGNYKPDNEYQYAVEALLGPAFGVTMRSLEGGLRLFDDDPKNNDRAVEAILPTALSNLAKSYRFATEGYETGRLDPIISGALPAGDVFRQSLGFAPISTRSARDKLSLNIRKDLGRRERRNRIIDKLVYAVSGEGEHSGLLTQAWQEAQAFNADYPAFPIGVDTLLRSIRARQTRTEMAAITGGAPVDRKTALEMLESNREFEEGISWMDW